MDRDKLLELILSEQEENRNLGYTFARNIFNMTSSDIVRLILWSPTRFWEKRYGKSKKFVNINYRLHLNEKQSLCFTVDPKSRKKFYCYFREEKDLHIAWFDRFYILKCESPKHLENKLKKYVRSQLVKFKLR